MFNQRHLILATAPGRMCNTLWAYSLFMHLAARRGYRVYSRYLGRYSAEAEWRGQRLGERFLGSRRLLELLSLRGPRWERMRRLLGVPERSSIGEGRVQVLDAWASLGSLLPLLGPLEYSVSEHVRLLDDGSWYGHEPALGLHIRRGDYRIWRGGRYCYSLEHFERLLQGLVDASGTKRVFIATDDPAARDHFGGREDVFFSPEATAAQDLVGLSMCEAIVGPPSSFSMFASSYGRTPLSWLFDASTSAEAALAEASVVVSFYRFASGKVLCDDGGEALFLKQADHAELRTFGRS